MRSFGIVVLVVGAVLLCMSLLPWVTCTSTWPQNREVLRSHLVHEPAPDVSGGAICWEVHPPWRETLPLGAGFASLMLGATLVFFGRAPHRARSTSSAASTMPRPPSQQQPPRITHAQRELEARAKPQLSSAERDTGIEVDAVELDEAIGRTMRLSAIGAGSDPDEMTLMDQVNAQLKDHAQRAQERQEDEVTVDGFYCPNGLSHQPLFYVDPHHHLAQDDDATTRGERDTPFASISAALDRARALVRQTQQPVQVRVMPGVYQEALKLPPRVMLVNHRMPAEGGTLSRLNWLLSQHDVSSPDRVTLLAPPQASEALVFEPGHSQGVFGLHLVGRAGVEQTGLVLRRSDNAVVMACIIEQFEGRGAYVELCGSDLLTGGVRFVGCALRENRALEGGAIAMRESAVLCEGCLFERNTARRGGAICAWGMRSPLTLVRCELSENRAQLKHADEATEALDALSPQAYNELEGTGGAMWVGDSALKIAHCDFLQNGASVAGGALALVRCKALLQGSDEEPLRIKGGRSRAGGGILAVGALGELVPLKLNHVQIEENLGQRGGGGIMLVGGVVAQLDGVRLEGNHGDELSSLGGGLLALHGAEVLGNRILVQRNKAARGGGMALRNASVRLRERCVFQDNVATFGDSGALLMDVASRAFLDEAVSRGELRLPFVVKLLEVECVGNWAVDAPSAVGIGSVGGGPSVMAVVVELGEGVALRANRVEGRREQLLSDQLQVVWRGEQRVELVGRVKAQRLVLR